MRFHRTIRWLHSAASASASHSGCRVSSMSNQEAAIHVLNSKCLYDMFHVPPYCDAKEIKVAYHKLIKKIHPDITGASIVPTSSTKVDHSSTSSAHYHHSHHHVHHSHAHYGHSHLHRHHGGPDYHAAFLKAKESFDTLSDPSARQKYDTQRGYHLSRFNIKTSAASVPNGGPPKPDSAVYDTLDKIVYSMHYPYVNSSPRGPTHWSNFVNNSRHKQEETEWEFDDLEFEELKESVRREDLEFRRNYSKLKRKSKPSTHGKTKSYKATSKKQTFQGKSKPKQKPNIHKSFATGPKRIYSPVKPTKVHRKKKFHRVEKSQHIDTLDYKFFKRSVRIVNMRKSSPSRDKKKKQAPREHRTRFSG